MSADTTVLELEGNLETMPVARLLAEAWRDRRTGQLVLTRDKVSCRVQITSGSPTAIESEPAADHFALTLETSQTISVGDRLKVEKFAHDNDCAQARAVLALGLLDAQTLYQKLRDTMRQEISALLEWRRGEFIWEADTPDTKPGKPLDVLRLIQEELPKRWDLGRLFEDLLPHSERVCEIVPNVRRIALRLAESGPMAQRMIQGINGSTSIGRMLGEAAGDAAAASTLWVLIHAGLVRNSEAAGKLESPVLEFEVLVDSALQHGASNPSATGHSTDMSSSVSTTVAAVASKASSIRAEVARLVPELGNISHYEILGLDSDANAAQVKKAYFKAAKKFHPDALGQLDLDDIEDEAAKVFARISDAFETLSNAKKREAYDRGDVEATNIDTARLAQAETSFRKGEILIRMGNFAGSLEYLERSVDLWPEEPAYQAALGWALFKQPKTDLVRAREHLAMAHDMAANDARILFRLGLVLRDMGESERSKECIVRARRLDPDVSD